MRPRNFKLSGVSCGADMYYQRPGTSRVCDKLAGGTEANWLADQRLISWRHRGVWCSFFSYGSRMAIFQLLKTWNWSLFIVRCINERVYSILATKLTNVLSLLEFLPHNGNLHRVKACFSSEIGIFKRTCCHFERIVTRCTPYYNIWQVKYGNPWCCHSVFHPILLFVQGWFPKVDGYGILSFAKDI